MEETHAHFLLPCSLFGPTLPGLGKPCSLHMCACAHAQMHAGGNVDFVFGTQKNGAAFWAKTESSSGTHPGGWDWARLDTELHAPTLAGRLADHLIRSLDQGQEDFIDSCEGVRSGECINQRPNLDAPGWGWDACCLLWATMTPDLGTLERYVAMPMNELSELWNPDCRDMLDPDWLIEESSLFWAPTLYGAIGDAVAGNACGCTDPMKTLCRGGHCVMPSCADLAQYCQEDSPAGLVARQWCPIMCGCDNAFSGLIYFDSNYGCSSTCLVHHKKQIAARACADAPAGSAELTASADGLAKLGRDQQYAPFVTFANGLRSVGCQALKEQESASFCSDGAGQRGLSLVCPVTCGCEGGCPSNCSNKPNT